jgi:hypothetical protein
MRKMFSNYVYILLKKSELYKKGARSQKHSGSLAYIRFSTIEIFKNLQYKNSIISNLNAVMPEGEKIWGASSNKWG